MFRQNGLLVALFSILLIGVVVYYLIGEKIEQKLDWRTYRSARHGYQINFPKDWVFTEEEETDLLTSPDEKALVSVNFWSDPGLLEGKKEEVLRGVREFMEDNQLRIESFEITDEGYTAKGELIYKNKRYNFYDIGKFVGNDYLAILTVGMQEETNGKQLRTVKAVAASFNPLAARVESMEIVRKQKEVQEYEERLKKAGSEATFAITDDGDNWLIQVYEIVEQDGGGHTATFNWYRVNKETKKITREF